MIRKHLLAAAGLCLAWTCAASAAEIPVAPANSQPESLAVAPNGDVIIGSSTAPKIYRAKKGAGPAEVWVDLTGEVTNGTVLGVYVDAPSKTVWACLIDNGLPGPGRKSHLRSFDLDSAKAKSSWALPDAANLCNDMTVGPDKSVYVADTFNGRIYKVAPDGKSGTLVIEDRALYGVDGITFMGGQLYVNTVFPGNLYRVALDAAGKGALTEIWMDRLVRNPDGMRAVGNRLYVAENAAGRISYFTVKGEKATVTTVKSGYKTPTAVDPHNGQLWIAERGADKVVSIPQPK